MRNPLGMRSAVPLLLAVFAAAGCAHRAPSNGAVHVDARKLADRDRAPGTGADETVQTSSGFDDFESAPGTETAATVQALDDRAGTVTFRLRETQGDLELQAGDEVTVAYDQLPALTGTSAENARARLHEGQSLEVKLRPMTGGGTELTRIDLSAPSPVEP